MKPLKILLVILFMVLGAGAMAQPRLVRSNIMDYRQRLNSLQLTVEQKARLAALIRRERLQFYLNQKELDEILTEKQKKQLMKWRAKEVGDSTEKKN